MAKQAHLFIYGDICNHQGVADATQGVVSLKSVVDVINANPHATEFIVHIHSRGGDVNEGFAIYDALVNTGKRVTTIIEGLCASIATVIALAGSVRKMNQNAEFMIHNAWADPFTMHRFTAHAYEEMAEFIREADDKLLNLYIQKTGANVADIQAKMQEETYLDAAEALQLGFITEVVEPSKAVAYIGRPQQKAKFKLTDMTKVKHLVAKAMKSLLALSGSEVTPATLADGTKIYYEGELVVGTAVFTDEELTTPAADGDLTLDDGTLLTIEAGVVAELVEPEEDAAQTDKKKPEARALRARIAALEKENAQAVAALKNINSRLACIGSTYTPPKALGGNPNKFRTQQGTETRRFIRPEKKLTERRMK